MKLVQFRVQNYRNILDSGPIEVGKVTAFVGQNEAGKSNLFEALYCINPITPEAYKPDEDWPVDQWDGRATANGKEVCSAEFALSELKYGTYSSSPRRQSHRRLPIHRKAPPSRLLQRPSLYPMTRW
jgi:predicted ATP-dependent endonuclease of OLD family